ncbi:MAG: hypothetical protein KIT25_03885 [Enhydrobacter sp.]|nr:MAG: hypothetical protein KIT25_03885 [Enhydrobacter sp.]
MRTIVYVSTMLIACFAGVSTAHAQSQIALSFDEQVAKVCAENFPKGVSYTGKMQTKRGGVGPLFPTDVRWDIAECRPGKFNSGERAIVISGDWWVDGIVTQAGKSFYYGLSGSTLTVVASTNSVSKVKKAVITLQDEKNFVVEMWYATYQNKTLMSRK